MRGVSKPLRIAPFGRLLASYTINEIGDSVGIVALALLVYGETEDAIATTALFLAGNLLPALVAPALTARLDQGSLRRVLPTLYALEAMAFGVLAAIANDPLLPLVYALAAVDGTLALVGRALTRGAVGTLLEPKGLLREGNALINVGFALAAVSGAALGGVLVGQWGVDVALSIDALSFLVIAAVLATSTDLPKGVAEPQPLIARLRAGLGYVRRHPRLRVLLGGEALALVLFTLIVPIEVIYARESLGTDEAGFGLLLSSWGAGLVIGSLVFMATSQRPVGPLILLSTAAVGIAYLGMSAADSLAAACLLSVLGGAGNGVQWVAVITAVQEATPTDYQARVVGMLESLNRAMPGVGFLIGGTLTALGSPRLAFAVAGAGVLVLVAMFGMRFAALARTAPLPAPAEPEVPLPVNPAETGAIAFLAHDVADGDAMVTGYVSAGAPLHELRAELSHDPDLASALAWARNRAPVVVLRLATGSDQLSVGSTPAPTQYGASHWKGSDASLLALAQQRASEASRSRAL